MPRPAQKINTPPVQSAVMTVREYVRTTGDSESAVRGRIATGQWREDIHFYRKRRRIRLIVDACNKWWSDKDG